MPRSPWRRKPSPRAPAPVPPQPMVAPGAAAGGGGGDEEFEVRNCNGFVFRRPLLPDAPDPAAPSAAEAGAGPGPEAARGERRRRRALLGLLKRYRWELSQWEALERDLRAPLPAPPPPEAAPASPRPAAASFSASVLDDLIAQAEVQEEWYKKITEFCDETDALNRTGEEAMVDAIIALPVWRDPRELMAALCTPDELSPGDNKDEGNGGFQRLDSQQGKSAMEAGRSIECKEAAATSSAALGRTKNSGEDRKGGPDQCTRCSHFGHTEKTCRKNHAQLGDELPPPVFAENRKRKEVASPICSNSVAGQPTNKPKRTKASGSTPTPPGAQSAVDPFLRGKVGSTPARAPDIFCSPGPTTRRRAAAQNVSPRV